MDLLDSLPVKVQLAIIPILLCIIIYLAGLAARWKWDDESVLFWTFLGATLFLGVRKLSAESASEVTIPLWGIIGILLVGFFLLGELQMRILHVGHLTPNMATGFLVGSVGPLVAFLTMGGINIVAGISAVIMVIAAYFFVSNAT